MADLIARIHGRLRAGPRVLRPGGRVAVSDVIAGGEGCCQPEAANGCCEPTAKDACCGPPESADRPPTRCGCAH